VLQPLGKTPTEHGEGVTITAGDLWCVKPLKLENPERDMRRLLQEVERHDVPGLHLSSGRRRNPPLVTDERLQHLKDLDHLRYLNLCFCQKVTDAGLVWLKNLKNLEYLDLQRYSPGKKISDTGIAALGGLQNLRALNLKCCGITDRAVDTLVKLRKLTYLDLQYASGITDDGLAKLTALPELQSIHLYGTQVTDAGLIHLARMARLKHVGLPANISDKGFAHVCRAASLESVSVYKTGGLTDAGLAHLSKLGGLSELSLHGSKQITDAGLAHLSKLGGLSELSLHHCEQITDAGLRHLEGLPALQQVDLAGTKVTERGKARLMATLAENRKAAGRAEAAAEHAWKQIADYARRVALNEQTAARIRDALDKFDEKYGRTEFAGTVADDMATLRERIRPHLPRPKAIRFDSRVPLEVSLIKDLRRPYFWDPENRGPLGKTPCPRGKEIIIPAGRSWVVVPSNPAEFRDEDVAALAREAAKKNIPGISLGKCRKVTDAGVAALKDLTELRHLALGYCSVTDAGAAHLRGLRNLTHLGLGSTKVTGAAIDHLSALPRLQDLFLFGIPVKDSDVAGLSKLRHLRALTLSAGHLTDEGLGHLAEIKSLEYLRLNSARITATAARRLAKLPKLSWLKLGDCSITDEAVAQLARCPVLEVLNFSHAEGLTDTGVEHLSKIRALRILVLRATNVTNRCVPALKACTKVEHVDLHGTKVTEGAKKELEEFLKKRR
jgi:hypothetical protein